MTAPGIGRLKRWMALWAAVIALALCPRATAAEPVSEEAKQQAIAVYQEGSAAFQAKRYKDAIDLFLKADGIVQNAAFAFNISLAYRAMGDQAAALRWAREYLRRDPEASDRSEVEASITEYQAYLVTKGVQQVTVRSEPTGATLVLDDQPVGVTPWTGEIKPGPHVVRLQLRGYRDGERSFGLQTDRAMDVDVELVAKPADPGNGGGGGGGAGGSGGAGGDGANGHDGSMPLWPIGAGVAGVGVVAIVIAIGLEAARAGAEDDAVNAPNQIEAADNYDSMEGLQTGARVTVGIGAVLVAAGAALVVIDLTSSSEADEASMALRCGLGGCTIAGSF